MAYRLGEILIEKRLITTDQLDTAIKAHQESKYPLGKTLVGLGMITEARLLEEVAKQQGLPFIDLKDVRIEEAAIKKVPAKFAWHYRVMPVRIENDALLVASSDFMDTVPIEDLEVNLGYRVSLGLATAGDIADAIRKYYGVGADTIEQILAEAPHEQEREEIAVKERVEDLGKDAESASVIRLVNQILQQAIKDRATDIHFEQFRNDLSLRYRVDGILYDTQVSDNIKFLYPSVISRIKVMSKLDIIERRIPQDGRAKVKIGTHEYELRVSVIPTLYGENIAIRVLPSTMLFSISDLGMPEVNLTALNKCIENPHGIIFVTGPTGSGKTTTLYACLSKLNTRDRKIITIEDPVEYELKGISQIQVNSKISLTFSKALRSILRHDPDVIMVGEVRDLETAEVTIQTSLTGHLVFSTLHTNDAAGGVTRLIDMGVDPFLITSSVTAFVAQRLVRVICKHCKEEVKSGDETRFLIEKESSKKGRQTVYRGKGCKACNQTGYQGRTGIYEIMVMSEKLRKLVLQKASADQITEKAIELGMTTIRQDGWRRVLEGVTTTEEVLRVTQTKI